MSKLVLGGLYRHMKTDKHYIVLDTAICATNSAHGDSIDVIYRQANHRQKFTRALPEFMEKFEFLRLATSEDQYFGSDA